MADHLHSHCPVQECSLLTCRTPHAQSKLYQMLMLYDDELRNPVNAASGRLERIERFDYDKQLEEANLDTADTNCAIQLGHLVPQVCPNPDSWIVTAWPEED